jgi:protoporphyrinogen oxidase
MKSIAIVGGGIAGLSAAFELERARRAGAGISYTVFEAAERSGGALHSTSKNGFVIVNFLRRALGEEIGGHISPLGAYDEKSDRFLILDVARYKYPPVWVKTADLFDAMNTPDSDNDNKTRGYVLVSSRVAAGNAPAP